MPERLDLGPCAALRHERSSERCVVLLPGMVYPTRAPVLWFARESAMAAGYSVIEVLGEPADHPDKLGWERESAERAIAAAAPAEVVVIGKSLASFLAGPVAERGLPAAWLTPALNEPAVIEGLTKARQPTLLLGGSADPMWVAGAIPENPSLEVVELPGLDHVLQVEGDPGASLDALHDMTEALMGWLGRL